MVTGKIYIGFDFYHAGVYAPEPDSNREDWPGYETYGHDLDRYYFVVSACLIQFEKDGAEEGDPVEIGDDSSPDLVSYLSLWGEQADRDTSGLTFVTLDRETIRDLRRTYSADWRMTVTPVPLPPGLDLRLSMTIEQEEEKKAFAIQRQLGADAPPFAMGAKNWIAFARDNFIQIPITNAHRLSPAQRKACVDWVISAATVAIRKRDVGETLFDGETALLDSIRDLPGLGEGLSATLRDRTSTRFWMAILAVTNAGDENLPPPRPVFERAQLHDRYKEWDTLSDQQRLELREELFGKKVGGNNDTYLEFVGVAFRALTQNPSVDPAESAQRAQEAMSRLLGFGERLRWPTDLLGSEPTEDLMVLRSGRTRNASAFITNAHSLLGLVFRMGPYKPTAEVTIDKADVSFRIGTGGLKRLDGSADKTFAARFASATKNLLDDVRTTLGDNKDFKATLSPAHANGILFARPRSLQMEVAKGILAPPDGQRRLFRVPAAFLDAIDKQARAEYPPVGETDPVAAVKIPFHKRTAPQRLIQPSDLFMHGQDLELDHADRTACAALQVKVSRLLLRFADQVMPAKPVYEIRFVNQLNAVDLSFVRKRMDEVLAGGNPKDGELWVTTGTNGRPEKTEAFDLVGQGFSSAPSRDDENNQPIYTVVDDAQNTLTGMIGNAVGNPSGETGEGGPTVQFDLVVKPGTEKRFNLIVDGRGTGSLTLHPAEVFTTRLSRSAERLHERFDATLHPSPPAPEKEDDNMAIDPATNDAVLDDFGNFKKLRLELWPKAPYVPKIGLTYPASLQPLPSRRDLQTSRSKAIPADYRAVGPDNFSPMGPHLGYWIAHQFTEEIVGNVRDDGDAEAFDDDEAHQELGRYALYTNPGSHWSLTGHIENVYNHRVPVAQTDVHLGLSVDVRSLASARSMTFIDRPGGGEKPKSPKGRIALRYEIKGKTPPETLLLTLDSTFIKYAVEEYRNADAADEGAQPGRLRFLYEALADLKHCLAPGADPGHVKLALERWNFDNRRRVNAADDHSATQERSLPSMLGSLRCDGRAFRSLNAKQLAAWTDLLAPTFDEFVANLERNQTTDLPIEIPLQDGGWNWVFGQVDAIGKSTNVVRLGLSLKRAGHVTATPAQADGDPVMLREELIGFDDGLFGYNKDWDKTDPPGRPYTPDGERERSELLVRAANATRTYLDDRGTNETTPDGSALHKSFRWVATEPPELKGRRGSGSENTDDDTGSRQRRIFGAATEFSHFPSGIRERVADTSHLYLVLYAMKPVVRHKFFRDAATTEMFLQYLIDLVSDLLAGRHSDRIALVKNENMDATVLYKHRADLRNLANALSKKLVDTFLDRVDDVNALLGPERQDRLDQAETIEDPVVRQKVIERTHREFDAFARVNALADTVRADSQSGSDVAIRAMIRKDPSVVNWAKGFAVGVFDPDSFSKRLYSLRVRRRIGPTKMTGEGIVAAERRFHGDPITHESILQANDGVNYFVEALPDSVYQHSFWIDQNDGDMRARTAEDVIENENPYQKPGAGRVPEEKRNLSLFVDHYNPEWQLRPLDANLERAEERYFLPSRDAPVIPVPIEPETGAEPETEKGADGAKLKNPWYSEMFFREQDRSSQESLRDIFQRRLRQVLTTDVGDGTESGKRRIPITPSMAAVSIPDTLTFAELPDGSNETTAGWHFIDTYLSHFLFILTPDEEAVRDQPNRPDIGLRNDTIQLEVDRFVKLPPDNREPADVQPFDAKTGLHGWFAYSRAKAAQGARNDSGTPPGREPPKPMAIEDVIQELDVWINKPASDQHSLGENNEIGLTEVDDLFRANQPTVEPVFKSGTARLSFDRRTSKWKLIVKRPPKDEGDTDPADDGVGSVVAVDLMRQVPLDEGEDKTVPARVIMRVTVLDETRTRTRTRAQIMRNQVDVDGDLDGDLNPAFVRVTPFSEWASYPPYLLTYTEDEVLQFPEPVRFLVVGAASEAASEIQSLNGWVNADHREHDFGRKLIWQNALNKQLGTPNGLVNLFTFDTRSDTNLNEPFLIDGSVMQMLGDHVHRAESTLKIREKIAARHDAIVTQLLRPAPDDDGEGAAWLQKKGKNYYTATASGFAAMLKHMDRKKIQSADPNIVVTWYTPEGVPIMEINWPVVWQDDLDTEG